MYFFGPDANAAIAAASNSEAQQIEQEKAAIKVQQMEQEKADAIEAVINRMEQEKVFYNAFVVMISPCGKGETP